MSKGKSRPRARRQPADKQAIKSEHRGLNQTKTIRLKKQPMCFYLDRKGMINYSKKNPIIFYIEDIQKKAFNVIGRRLKREEIHYLIKKMDVETNNLIIKIVSSWRPQ
ncbi:unnamed protein product [marine sediment metagenome]|uniref:Uncharacterized protein n=1 Tax=marine sediment metagenome TaxID=412755 RepID=X1E185_9ZZZZ